jgi:hypothetical protein
MYICDNRKFNHLKAAIAYMRKEYRRTGVMLKIVQDSTPNKNPGYVAYLAKGMTL